MTGGKLHHGEAEAGDFLQQCSWSHSTEEGISSLAIEELSIYANGRDFRLEKLMWLQGYFKMATLLICASCE